MFKAMKSIAKSLKAWTRPTRRSMLVPLTPAQKPDDTAAIDTARQKVLATLGAVVDKKRADFNAAIGEADIDIWDFMRNGLHAECLMGSLHKLNFHGADNFNDDQLGAFAVAKEYFCRREDLPFMGAITIAAATVKSGNYEYYPGIETYEELGQRLIDKALDAAGFYRCLPEIVDDYIDYERLGEDYTTDHVGEFTCYGWFCLKG